MTFEELKGLAFGRITVEELSQSLVQKLGDITKAEATTIAEGIKTTLETAMAQGDAALDARIQAIETSLASGEIYGQIQGIKSNITAVEARVTSVEGQAGTLSTTVSNLKGEVSANKSYADGRFTEFTHRTSALESDVAKLKSTVSGKNNPTQVFATMEEFNAYHTENKDSLLKGDMAFVVSVKKSYIYNPAVEVALLDDPTPPEGWMFFDEITNELDLADYAKKVDLVPIQEAITKLNADQDTEGSVDYKIKQVKDALEAVDAGLRTDVDQAKQDILANAAAIAEVTARGFILSRKQELVDAVAEQTVYELAGAGVSENFIADVFVNSVRLIEGEDKDYTLVGKTLTLKKARSAGSVIQVLFTFLANAPQA